MGKPLERFEITPSASKSAKFYHCFSMILLFFLVLATPVIPIFQISLVLIVATYAWFAWPTLNSINFDARLNGADGNRRLMSALHLLIGWRLRFEVDTKTQVIWFFDDQLSRDDHRMLNVASHLEQLKRQASN